MKHAGFSTAAAKTGLIVVAVAGGLLLAALVNDIHEDRTYRVVITGAVSVYAEPELPDTSNNNPVLTVLGPQDEVEVRRIDREEGWIRVRLHDHREGYVFLDSRIELKRR